jgi:hypothetical protein
VNADFVNLASSNYNSLQITLSKRLSSGFQFNINHTWSKTLSDAGAGRSAYFWEIEKTHGESDRRHVFNALLVYEPPFGPGKAMNPSNVVTRSVLSGWRISSITRLRSGLPYGVIGAACNLPQAGGCRANYAPGFSGPVRINGDWGSGDLLGARPIFLDSKAFASPAAYTYGNTPGAGAYGFAGSWNETSRHAPVLRTGASSDFSATHSTSGSCCSADLPRSPASYGRVRASDSPRSIRFAEGEVLSRRAESAPCPYPVSTISSRLFIRRAPSPLRQPQRSSARNSTVRDVLPKNPCRIRPSPVGYKEVESSPELLAEHAKMLARQSLYPAPWWGCPLSCPAR